MRRLSNLPSKEVYHHAKSTGTFEVVSFTIVKRLNRSEWLPTGTTTLNAAHIAAKLLTLLAYKKETQH